MAFITSAALPRSSLAHGVTPVCRPRPALSIPRHTTITATPPAAAPFTIEAAKHAQFKAAKKAERKRPRKHRPSDINRRAPSFNTEPLRTEGLPSCYTVVSEGDENDEQGRTVFLPEPEEEDEVEDQSPAAEDEQQQTEPTAEASE